MKKLHKYLYKKHPRVYGPLSHFRIHLYFFVGMRKKAYRVVYEHIEW